MNLLFKKQKLIIRGLTLLLFVGTLSGCYFFPEEEEVLAPPLKKPEKIIYNTIDVGKGNIENNVKVIGHIVSVEQITLSFEQRGGYLKEIYKRIGEEVEEGELLAELDTDSLENEVKKQEIILTTAKKIYNQLLKTGNVDVELAEMELERLKSEYQEMKTIESAYAPFDIKDMEQNIKKQEIMVVKSKNQYERNVSNTKKEVDMAQIQLDTLLLDFEKSKIYAPISGEINWISDINEGEKVYARDKFITIADLSRLQLEYSGDKSSEFIKGMEVEVGVDNKIYKGRVVMTASDVPYEEYEKYKYTVKFEVDDLPDKIEIGKSTQIKAVLNKRENVIVVPKSVVHSYTGTHFVKVFENGLVSDRDVEIGIESSTEYEILKGLEVGEKVLK